MKLFFLSAAIMLLPFSSFAEDSVYVYLGGFSKHFEDRTAGKEHNEVHNNVGLEYESEWHNRFSDKIYWGVTGQYMVNSLDNDSAIAGATLKKRWEVAEDVTVGIGGLAGVQNGYPKASEGRDKDEFVPVAYPIAELNYGRFGVYGTCVPKIYSSEFCFAGFKVKAYSWE